MDEQVLLVDDEPGILKVLGISLADRGYRVFTAESGEEALRIFNDARPDIVLTDIKMPAMDGIELLKRIKQESPNCEVIMITGHGDMELAIQSLKYDASDFITKPIHDDALDIALRRALEKLSYKRNFRSTRKTWRGWSRRKRGSLWRRKGLPRWARPWQGWPMPSRTLPPASQAGMYVLEKGIESGTTGPISPRAGR
jgi:DNA-binding NtrC family response regulator